MPNEYQLIQRQRTIVALYLTGASHQEIATKLGVSRAVVTGDLKRTRDRWLKEMGEDLRTLISGELARVDLVEASAWDSWEKSCADAEVKSIEKTHYYKSIPVLGRRGVPTGENRIEKQPGEVTIKRQVRGQTGDPRFLMIIQGCIRDRINLLRLGGDVKTTLPQLDDEVVNTMPPDYWDRLCGKSDVVDPVGPRIVELTGQTPEPVSEKEGVE